MREHETSAPNLGEENHEAAMDLIGKWLVWDADRRQPGTRLGDTASMHALRDFVAEAVASARAEGVKEGLERAAKIAEDRPDGWGAEYSFAASLVAGDIRALIPGGSSDV